MTKASTKVYVPQRGQVADCVIAVLATLTGEKYETIARALNIKIDPRSGSPTNIPPDGINIHHTIYALFLLGWSGAMILAADGKNGEQNYPNNQEIKSLLDGRNAAIGYTDPDPRVGGHSLAWNGKEAIDCSNGELVSLDDIVIDGVLILTRHTC